MDVLYKTKIAKRWGLKTGKQAILFFPQCGRNYFD